MAMSTASRKAKGRRLQQEVRDDLLKLAEPYGLVTGDVESVGMGQSGVDIILSPAAKKIFPYHIECKNQEALNVFTTYVNHHAKYKKLPGLSLLIHSKNHADTLVTMHWSELLNLIRENLELKHGKK